MLAELAYFFRLLVEGRQRNEAHWLLNAGERRGHPRGEFPPLNPHSEAKMDPNFMMKVVGDHAPARGLPVKHPRMHQTRTVDYAIKQ
jgi:hypothetical protein